MRQKLLIIALIISMIGIISSCQKEIKNNDSNTEKVQTKPFDLETMKANTLKYMEMIERVDQGIKETMPIIRQNIENLKLGLSQRLGNSGILEKSSPKKAIIHIPADYPTLQQAVDNAAQNGKIIVTGTVTDLDSVFVNVSNLIIQGENETSTINGKKLIISASGVTVKNLNINMGIVISGNSNGTLVNNKIRSAINMAGGSFNGIPLDMAILIDQSSNCILKNNEIKGIDNYIGIHIGILINGGSGHTFESNNISFDLILNNRNFFECIHGEGANNNKIANCNIKSNISFNSGINSFGIYMKGSGNEVTNCKAENVSGSFVLFGDNNKINNCEARVFKWAGFEANGKNNSIKNCKVDGNLNGYYNGNDINLWGYSSFYGENNVFENCEAKNNIIGFKLGSDNALSSSGYLVSNCTSYSNNFYGVLLYKSILCMLQNNNIYLNGIVGLNLVQVSNSGILKNISNNNTVCDFNQTNCSGNTLTNNQFGTSCTGL